MYIYLTSPFLNCTNIFCLGSSIDVFTSPNCIRPPGPISIPLQSTIDSPTLDSNKIFNLPIIMHAPNTGKLELHLMLIYRGVSINEFCPKAKRIDPLIQTEEDNFRSICIRRSFSVKPLLDISLTSRPSYHPNYMFVAEVVIQNKSLVTEACITELSAMSPAWEFNPLCSTPW